MTWDGINRRKDEMNKDNHTELLIRIDEKVSNLVDNVASHVKQDEKDFKSLKDKSDWHDKVIYLGIGGLAVIQFVLKVIK